MWRNVSFVERIELDFSGNIFNHAIVLGDVDNDQGHELAVGNTDGDLAIFKGSSKSPWKRCSSLGMITCIGVGDVFNKGKNVLVALTAEGWCNIFDIKADSSSETSKDLEAGDHLAPTFNQHLPANGKVLLIEDVDGDGKVELTVAYSDRVVRCFRWSTVQDPETEEVTNNLIQIQKWQLAGQIGSLTVNFTEEGHPELLVAQPGGEYVTMTFKQGSELDLSSDSEGYNEEVLKSDQRANQSASTEIIGGISRQTSKQPGTYYAICTLDGNLLLVEKKQILWSLQVDHQLFSLKKLDVTGNGKEEVVCCSWDGQTYIVNHNRAVVRYQFQESVAAFTAGLYGVDNNPSFVYATYNNKIYIYNSIQLPQVESTNLIEVMEKRENTQELLDKIGLQDAHPTQLRDLYHWLLYGWRDYT
ncbi:KICSTOR complex protein ITFG2 [Magallana gigas]|uniref:Integrin-alpha FG-GAP repeat-containing protein 2 n=1 Tax=Magallana gigas TaxID=29159 RepID=A0A8W8N4D1_MAGGI|nr:KICSTOR complex protein ITFG2 [Crassostrea gigas]|eukprot:XP_011454196.1 PREDICTED: integrin-alpha FG-GAP repeat-containing protein 2 [Crassostrea gigas]